MPRRLATGTARDLVRAERDIRGRIGDQPLDFAAMAAVSNIYRAANVIRNHMERKVLADEDLSWAAFTVMFVLIGAEPRTQWLPAAVRRDPSGFVLTGTDLLQDGRVPEPWPLRRQPMLLESSLPGVFAAGDVRHGSVKRVASAVGEGSIAIHLVHRYLHDS